MNSQHDPHPHLLPTSDAELLAWLDGNLSEKRTKAFEESLAHDPVVRQKADALLKAWNMLDLLPHASVPVTMTATTIEMLALRVQDEGLAHRREHPKQVTNRWLFSGGIVFGAIVLGLVLGTRMAPDPDAAVWKILPLATHIEVLNEAGSVEFLQGILERSIERPRVDRIRTMGNDQYATRMRDTIDDLRLHASSGSKSLAPVPVPVPSTQTTRQKVELMSSIERQDLAAAVRVFERKSGSERAELLELAGALLGPSGNQLATAATVWHSWLMSRDPVERSILEELDTEERLEWLDRYARKTETRPVFPPDRTPGRGRRANPADTKAAREWFERIVKRQTRVYAESLEADARDEFEKKNPQEQVENIAKQLSTNVQLRRAFVESVTPIDFDLLLNHLSSEARARVESVQDPAARVRQLAAWLVIDEVFSNNSPDSSRNEPNEGNGFDRESFEVSGATGIARSLLEDIDPSQRRDMFRPPPEWRGPPRGSGDLRGFPPPLPRIGRPEGGPPRNGFPPGDNPQGRPGNRPSVFEKKPN